MSEPQLLESLANTDAEEAVLAAMLIDQVAAVPTACTYLTGESFSRPAHRMLFDAMRAIADREEVLDPLTLANELEARGELTRAGGKEYLGFLVDAVPTSANIEYHAKIVRDFARRRALVAIGNQLRRGAHDRGAAVDSIAGDVSTALAQLVASLDSGGYRPLDVIMREAVSVIRDRINGVQAQGVLTGFRDIDEGFAGGLQGGDLVFLPGIPSCGKTVLALTIARNASFLGFESAFISAETKDRKLAERLLNASAGITTQEMRSGKMGDLAFAKLLQESHELAKLPFWIDDAPTPFLRDIEAKTRALKARRPGLKLAVLDFVQLVRLGEDDENRALALTEISYGLKRLARQLDLAVIATCQVDASAVEGSADGRPKLRHIRWSQAMREAAEIIGLCHRPNQFDHQAPSVFEVAFDKFKDMPTFDVRLKWEGQYMRLSDMPRPAAPQPRLFA